jgi:Domain of unknown function (DUF2017)
VSARFTATESGLIRSLVSQVAELITGDPAAAEPGAAGGNASSDPGGSGPAAPDDLAGLLEQITGPAEPPEDPVLARLFPDAYRDDPAASGEFRRFTEDGLRSAKTDTARLVLATLPEDGGRVVLTSDEGQAWLRALNDVRLALGVRLEITEDFAEQLAALPPDDPRAGYFQVYDWLTYVQETLVRALW